MKVIGKTQIEKVVEIRCDCCGRTFYDTNSTNYHLPSIEDNIISIDHVAGYSSNFDNTRFVMDICVDCFASKVMPLKQR